MSAQDLLLAHGEKALVLLVTAACGYGLYGAAEDDAGALAHWQRCQPVA